MEMMLDENDGIDQGQTHEFLSYSKYPGVTRPARRIASSVNE